MGVAHTKFNFLNWIIYRMGNLSILDSHNCVAEAAQNTFQTTWRIHYDMILAVVTTPRFNIYVLVNTTMPQCIQRAPNLRQTFRPP